MSLSLVLLRAAEMSVWGNVGISPIYKTSLVQEKLIQICTVLLAGSCGTFLLAIPKLLVAATSGYK